jgi:hypothetical protein
MLDYTDMLRIISGETESITSKYYSEMAKEDVSNVMRLIYFVLKVIKASLLDVVKYSKFIILLKGCYLLLSNLNSAN